MSMRERAYGMTKEVFKAGSITTRNEFICTVKKGGWVVVLGRNIDMGYEALLLPLRLSPHQDLQTGMVSLVCGWY